MKIVAVTHARGVEFPFDGAKDKNGNPYTIRVEELKRRGVQFVMRGDGAPWRAGRRCAKMAVAFFRASSRRRFVPLHAAGSPRKRLQKFK